MRMMMTTLGIICLAAGLVWMGQGAGYIRWPAESFMIDETAWIYYGGMTAAAGLLIISFARRR
jgi:hypothetical protein